MKKIFSVLSLVLLAWMAKAQTSDGNSNNFDSTRHRFAQHTWSHRGTGDSLHKRQFQRFNRENNGMAMNRFSHEGRMRGGYGRNRFGGHRQMLHYSSAQRQQMMTINRDYQKKASDLYKQDNLTLKEYKSQLLALQKAKKSALAGLLTPEQKKQVEDFKVRAWENAQVMAAARLERMKIRLKLTDDQSTAIKMSQQKTRDEVRSIRENDNLMADQKREQIRSVAVRQKEAIKSLLTSEQRTELENMHRQRMGAR